MLSHSESLKCGDTTATVSNAESVNDPFFNLNISNKELSKKYQFEVQKDYFRIRCDRTANGTFVFLILHFCGGSGCTDLYNFGIINAATGAILLEPDQPHKGNAIKANAIMGTQIKPFTCSPDNGEICFFSKIELG